MRSEVSLRHISYNYKLQIANSLIHHTISSIFVFVMTIIQHVNRNNILEKQNFYRCDRYGNSNNSLKLKHLPHLKTTFTFCLAKILSDKTDSKIKKTKLWCYIQNVEFSNLLSSNLTTYSELPWQLMILRISRLIETSEILSVIFTQLYRGS